LWIGDRRIRSKLCITLYTVRALGRRPVVEEIGGGQRHLRSYSLANPTLA
jgi:hypothetical protein